MMDHPQSPIYLKEMPRNNRQPNNEKYQARAVNDKGIEFIVYWEIVDPNGLVEDRCEWSEFEVEEVF